ncbi:MAG: Photosystem I reaction center subunit III [Cyanothece sp. SIO1E1]|nr:Photosystem I reaction center subunit III [Cyanothece sp. SIO1E1]
MRRLFALASAICLWLGLTPPAAADVAGLTPCGESAAFLERASNAINEAAARRFEFYGSSGVLCGDDGLPHLVVDGRLSHAGEFIIPGLMFLFIAGWIGWVGRAYLIAIRAGKNAAEKEILIDVPLAIKCMLSGFSWPLAALGEFTSGKLTVSDDQISVSPR